VNKKFFLIAAGAIIGSTGLTELASANGDTPTKFSIRIENITKPDTFTASNGVKWSLAYSPGTAVIHAGSAPIFTAGQKDRGQGLEAQAEDGDPSKLAKALKSVKGVKSVAVYNTPIGDKAPGPITPGAAYETTVSALPGDKLSITLMMGQSNDWFFAPADSGIELFKDGKAISGDVSSQIMLWNAGTEVDQEPGIGPDQGPRQKGPNTGAAENGVVSKVQDGKTYAQAEKVLRVTIKPMM
jgi:hypothetical protein